VALLATPDTAENAMALGVAIDDAIEGQGIKVLMSGLYEDDVAPFDINVGKIHYLANDSSISVVPPVAEEGQTVFTVPIGIAISGTKMMILPEKFAEPGEAARNAVNQVIGLDYEPGDLSGANKDSQVTIREGAVIFLGNTYTLDADTVITMGVDVDSGDLITERFGAWYYIYAKPDVDGTFDPLFSTAPAHPSRKLRQAMVIGTENPNFNSGGTSGTTHFGIQVTGTQRALLTPSQVVDLINGVTLTNAIFKANTATAANKLKVTVDGGIVRTLTLSYPGTGTTITPNWDVKPPVRAILLGSDVAAGKRVALVALGAKSGSESSVQVAGATDSFHGVLGLETTLLKGQDWKFIGIVRNDSSGNIRKFLHNPSNNFVGYLDIRSHFASYTGGNTDVVTVYNSVTSSSSTGVGTRLHFDDVAPIGVKLIKLSVGWALEAGGTNVFYKSDDSSLLADPLWDIVLRSTSSLNDSGVHCFEIDAPVSALQKGKFSYNGTNAASRQIFIHARGFYLNR